MRRIKLSVAATVVGCALLTPSFALPAMAAEAPTEDTVVSVAADVQGQLDQVDSVINTLRTAERSLSPAEAKTDYGKEIRQLLATAWELREAITAVATGGVPPFDVASVLPRVQLLTEVTNTIKIATTELTNKVEDAHIQIGFAITRALIRIGNPSASADQLNASLTELTQLVEKVRSYPDLTPADRATIYVKARLDKVIWETRFDRDKNILGKASFATYNELNGKITHAVGVWLNPAASVQMVDDEIAALRAAYSNAESQLP